MCLLPFNLKLFSVYPGTPVRSKSDKEDDCTLTMDSLMKTPKPEPSFSVSSLNLDDLGSKTPVGKSQINESRKSLIFQY